MIARAALASVLACAASVASIACGARAASRDTETIVVPATGSARPVTPTLTSDPTRAPPHDPKLVRGIGPVEIGQTVAELRTHLGPELRRSSYDEEETAFRNFNYDPKRVVAFLVGFDDVLVFNDDTVRSEPPIWKVYMKDDRAVLIKITSVGFEEHLREHKVGFPPSCFLLEPPQGIFDTFGQGYVEEQIPDHVTYHYVERGLSVMVFNDAIRVFDVFGDVGDATRARIKAALTQ